MKTLHTLAILIITTLIASTSAYACSCMQNLSMSKIVEDGAIVILASPVGGGVESEWSKQIYPERLRVWKTLAGQAAEFETVETRRGSTCAIGFPTSQISLIVAFRNENGSLGIGLCTNGSFSEAQWKTYFETGEDTPPQELCYEDIKSALDAVGVLRDEFKLSRPECAFHLDDYVKRFRVTE